MSLVNIREVYPDVYLGIWKIDETVEEFISGYAYLRNYSTEIDVNFKSLNRKREYLAIRVLLHEMLLNDGYKGPHMQILHNNDGKPFISRYNISISHTKGYATLILSKTRKVAVDIEFTSERVKKIASKFMRKDEKASCLEELLVHWCGKESVYKLFSEEKLQFSQMRVHPFSTQSDWSCKIDNLKSHCQVVVDFELTMDYVLAYTFM